MLWPYQLSPSVFEDTQGIYYLDGINDPKTRPLLKTNPEKIINSAINQHKPFIHPFKFSGIINGNMPKHINYFCKTLLPLYYCH